MSDTVLLAERVANDIEQMISDGTFMPGERIPSEEVLTSRFSVGRSTLREATNMLKARKVLESYRGRGTFVCERIPREEKAFSLAHLDKTLKNKLEILEIRLLLEPEAAALAALNATEEQIEQMKRQCSLVEAKMDADEDYGKADSGLHTLIAQSSGNQLLSELISIFVNSDFMSISSTDDECRADSRKCHRAIVESISRRDIQGAKYNMVNHIGYSRSNLIQQIPQ